MNTEYLEYLYYLSPETQVIGVIHEDTFEERVTDTNNINSQSKNSKS